MKNKEQKKIVAKSRIKWKKRRFVNKYNKMQNPNPISNCDFKCFCCNYKCTKRGNHYFCSNCDHLYKKWDKNLDKYYRDDFRKAKPFRIDKGDQQKNIRLNCVKKLSTILKSYLSKENSVLEVGAGDGLVANSISKYVSEISICDLDKSIIDIGLNFNFPAYCCSIFDLDNKQYDIVLAFDFIEHLDDIVAFEFKINKICKRYFIVSIPHPNRRIKYSKVFTAHVQEFSKKSLHELFNAWIIEYESDVRGIAGGLSHLVVFKRD